jgi:hypothetical protein
MTNVIDYDYEGLQGLVDDLEARIAELESERGWIPVSERLPDRNVDVIVYNELRKEVQTGRYNDARRITENVRLPCSWFAGGNFYTNLTDEPNPFMLPFSAITHWMPYPNPPEVQE